MLWIFWGHHKTGLVLGFISVHFRVLSWGQCSELWIFWGVAKILSILGVCLIFQIFFGGKQ